MSSLLPCTPQGSLSGEGRLASALKSVAAKYPRPGLPPTSSFKPASHRRGGTTFLQKVCDSRQLFVYQVVPVPSPGLSSSKIKGVVSPGFSPPTTIFFLAYSLEFFSFRDSSNSSAASFSRVPNHLLKHIGSLAHSGSPPQRYRITNLLE